MSLVDIPSGLMDGTTEDVLPSPAEERTLISLTSGLGDMETLDLDYDEDEPDDKDGENEEGALSDDSAEREQSTQRTSVEKEDGEQSSSGEEKEEGELEDGELSGSDEGEINSGPEDEKISDRITTKNRRSNFIRSAPQPSRVESLHKNETSWERGLREARAAMRRANVVRQDPDFQRKRLVAAPDGERIPGNYTDSDDCSRQSATPPRRAAPIPSLLDLRMSPPRQFRHPPKSAKVADLGPQVIYPNGRPIVNRRRERKSPKRRNRQSSPIRRNSPPRRRTRTPPSPASSRSTSSKLTRNPTVTRRSSSPPPTRFQGLSPARDASPVSSDSDMERYKSDDKVKQNNRKPKATDSVNDPWARKPLSQIVAEKAGERLTKRTQSSSGSSRSSSCSSSSSAEGRKRKRTSSSSSRSSKSSADEGYNRSPPRGDISGYRIPKKRKAAGGERRMTRQEIEDFFSKEKDMPKAFRKDKRRRSSVSSEGSGKNEKGSVKKSRIESPSKLAQNISDSDSDKSSGSSKSALRTKSCSPSVSRSRSVSPALPARYRDRSPEDSIKNKRIKSNVSSPRNSPPPPPPPDEKYSVPSAPPPIESSNNVTMNPVTDRKRNKIPTLPEDRQRRKRELQEQLRKVEEELKKRRVLQ